MVTQQNRASGALGVTGVGAALSCDTELAAKIPRAVCKLLLCLQAPEM